MRLQGAQPLSSAALNRSASGRPCAAGQEPAHLLLHRLIGDRLHQKHVRGKAAAGRQRYKRGG